MFDSGVGGLSVYDEIRQLLPDLHYIYAFDNVAFPYGEKSEDFIVERVVEIVTAVQKRYPLALAVIACNTAAVTVSLPALREKIPFPVVGVVPAIKPAARLTANGIMGLLATRGTVKRPIRELIERFANECQIAMLGSASWWKWRKQTAARRYRLKSCAVFCVHGCGCGTTDTVVLGCTRYWEELLRFCLKDPLVDSGAAIARRTAVPEHEERRMRNQRMRTSLSVWR